MTAETTNGSHRRHFAEAGMPRSIVRDIERAAMLPPGAEERFSVYGVMGLPFASGHILAMRGTAASSIGDAYRSVWHRSPEGAWTMWVDVDVRQSCPRYFGSELERAVQAPIEVAWPGRSRMTVRIGDGRELDWSVELGSTWVTRALSAVGTLMPSTLWRRGSVLSAIGAVGGPLLGAGRMALHGLAPNGQRYMVNPKRIWLVTGGRAVLNGTDLGELSTLDESVSLGDFVMPRRGIFAAGPAFWEPFNPDRHLALTTRQPA